MRGLSLAIALVIALAACRPSEHTTDEPSAAPPDAAEPSAPAAPGTPGGLPDDRMPLEEPNGAIDPKSTEAAGQVMQHYGALIEQKRFAEAEKYWRDPTRAGGVSDDFRRHREVHLQVGRPGRAEGAAGSVYVSVPLVLYGVRSDGASFSRSGEAVLRRVNEVSGSTAAQRTWHIDSMAFLERG